MIVLIRPPDLLSITWKIYQVKKPDSDLHSWQAGEIIVTLHWTFSRTSSGHSNAAAGILTRENIIPSNTLAPCSRQNDLLLIQTHSVFLARGSSPTRSVIPRIKSNVTAARIQEICMNLAFKQLTSSWWRWTCEWWSVQLFLFLNGLHLFTLPQRALNICGQDSTLSWVYSPVVHKSISNKWPSAASWPQHDSPSEIKILVKKKHFWDNRVDIRTSCTGLVLETAAASAAIRSLTWLFLVTEWRSVNSQPCHSIYKPEEAFCSPPWPLRHPCPVRALQHPGMRIELTERTHLVKFTTQSCLGS